LKEMSVRGATVDRVRVAGLGAALAVLLGFTGGIVAATEGPVKIGILSDMAGPISDTVGAGSVVAAELAVENAGGTVLGRPIEIVSADHQYKPDSAGAIVRRWYDVDGVDVVADAAVSVVGLMVQEIAKEKGKIALISGSGSTDLFGKACSPTGFIWSFDTQQLAKAVVDGATAGETKSWYFLLPDFSFGKQLTGYATDEVTRLGGSVAGSVRVAIGNSDFASPLTTAQASGAKVVGLAFGGHDLINSIKQAAEFGIGDSGQQIVAMFAMITDVNAIGLKAMQGAEVAETFYWDLDDDSRKFGTRFFERMKRYPTMLQAAVYSEITHYLKAVKAVGSTDADSVARKMRELPINDLTTKNARIRGDGRVIRDMYVFRVKKPSESRYPWDYYSLIRRLPGEELMSSTPSPDCPSPVTAGQ
jgi:branched-chain amino acid transport system substrate-binding protein